MEVWKRSGVRISGEWFPRRQYRRCLDNRTIITFYFSPMSLKWERGGKWRGVPINVCFSPSVDLLNAAKLWKCWNYFRLINAGRAGWVCAHNSVDHLPPLHAVVCVCFCLFLLLQHFVFSKQRNFSIILCCALCHICMLFPRFSPLYSFRAKEH